MSNFKLLCILNSANNFTSEIRLQNTVDFPFVRILANRHAQIRASFLADSYIINVIDNTTIPAPGFALAGSKISYPVKDRDFNYAKVTLLSVDTSGEELQIVFYFHE